MRPARPLSIQLPITHRGRRSAEAEAEYQRQRRAFCAAILEVGSRLDFRVSTRGWCYIAEEYGLNKGDFDRAETLINACRKSGELPIEISIDDETRETEGLESIDDDTPQEYAERCLKDALEQAALYTPTSVWDDQAVYVEVLVEKIDLKSLFGSVCEKYGVPITNLKGWADINTRAKLLRRFAHHARKGRHGVLLVCCDLDPGGLRISDFLRANLLALEDAVGWEATAEALTIERFGLNADFVRRHRLTWIDNLATGSAQDLSDADHKDHEKAYVQEYLAAYGPRKVEANALIVRPDAGRQLCRTAIEQYISKAVVDRYFENLEAPRAAVQRQLPGALQRLLRQMRSH